MIEEGGRHRESITLLSRIVSKRFDKKIPFFSPSLNEQMADYPGFYSSWGMELIRGEGVRIDVQNQFSDVSV